VVHIFERRRKICARGGTPLSGKKVNNSACGIRTRKLSAVTPQWPQVGCLIIFLAFQVFRTLPEIKAQKRDSKLGGGSKQGDQMIL
jgi:hypothetical protein